MRANVALPIQADFANGVVRRIDPRQLRIALIKLLENANDSLSKANSVAEQGELNLRCYRDSHAAIIEVEDTGEGIADSVLPHVFEPLFSTKGFGIGLGLPIVKQIVDQHGGEVCVTSTIGIGTRIVIQLPLAPS